MDRVVRLALAACLAWLTGPAFAIDYVHAQTVKKYTTTCVTGVSFTSFLPGVIGECQRRFIQQQTRMTTYEGCPALQTVGGSLSLRSETRENSYMGYASFAFSGTTTWSSRGTGSCANVSGSAPLGGPDYVIASAQWVEELGCEEGAVLAGQPSAQVCACMVGYMKQGDKCRQYTCPPSGSYTAVTQPDQKVTNAGDTVCTGGCTYVPSSWKVGQDDQIWATWPFKSSGGFCKGNPDPIRPEVDTGEKNSNNPAPVPCGTNQCPGTVNGATVCVPCKKQQEEGPSSSASAPSGSASGAGTGSTTTVACDGVSCTTTTTVRDGAGTVTGVIEKTEKQESFCKENPQSSLCKQSSFGGSCGAVTCDGDAVMCAIARDQYKRNCEWFEDVGAAALKAVGEAGMNGDLRPDGHPGKNASEQSVSFASVIDQTDRLGAGCPTDVSVNVAGKSVAIPFSSMCGNLQLIGSLMVGFCMFAAALIVFRS